MPAVLARRALAEFTGTAFLVAAVVGSGIAATRLSPNEVGLELLENSVVTGAVLVALILTLQPVSAAFNPVVTLVERALDAVTTGASRRPDRRPDRWRLRGCGGGQPDVRPARGDDLRASSSGAGIWLGEVVATLGLLVVIFGTVRSGRADRVAYAVGLYILAAYWFTSSTSFANPAVTIARMFSDTFAGIAPGSAVMFVVMQLRRRRPRLRADPAAVPQRGRRGGADGRPVRPCQIRPRRPWRGRPGAAGPGAAVPGAAGPGAAVPGAAGPVAGIPASDRSVTGGPGMTVRDEADVVRTDVHSR